MTDAHGRSVFRWGTVSSTDPLEVTLDGRSVALPVTQSLVDPLTLSVSDRVRCEWSGRRLIIHGRAGGTTVDLPDATTSTKGVVELATNAETQAGTDPDRVVTPAGLSGALPARGKVTGLPNIGNGSGQTVGITFPAGRFSTSNIVVVASPLVSARLNCAPLESGLTSSGCNVRLDNFSGGTASGPGVAWMAMEA